MEGRAVERPPYLNMRRRTDAVKLVIHPLGDVENDIREIVEDFGGKFEVRTPLGMTMFEARFINIDEADACQSVLNESPYVSHVVLTRA